MRRIFTRGARASLLMMVVLLSMVACGGAGVSETPVAPTGVVVANDAVPATSTPAPAASVGASVYASLTQSKTPAGYYVLGEPSAPVMMQYYSDFL